MSGFGLEVATDPDDGRALQAWVEVTADGVDLRLLLDSGTPRSAVPHAEPFASRPAHTAPGGGGVVGVAREETLVVARRIVVGDVAALDVTVDLLPRGWPHPGLLGMDVLGSHRCDFSFGAAARVEIDSIREPESGWSPLPSPPGRTPTVDLRWEAVAVSAVWDTGAGVTLVDQTWAERHPEVITVEAETGRGTDVTGAEISHPWGTMAPCWIGEVPIPSQLVAVIDFSAMNTTLQSPIEMIVGLPLIIRADWCFDFPERRWTAQTRS